MKTLVKIVFNRTKISPALTRAVIACLPEFVATTLAAGEVVRFEKFGSFLPYYNKARTVKSNLRSHPVMIHHKAGVHPRFKASPFLKKQIHQLTNKIT